VDHSTQRRAPKLEPNVELTEIKNEKTSTGHRIASRTEWLTARAELLKAEKALTRRSDELAKQRQGLPWVQITKAYRFETDEGQAFLADLFKGRSQLLIYHFMFGPQYSAGCPSCSSIADGFNGIAVHLANHDVMLWAVSRAPLAKLQAFKRRMGWGFPWASSFGTDSNLDFQAAHTPEQEDAGSVEYNFRKKEKPSPEDSQESDWMTRIAASTGTTWAQYRRETPGMSAFVLEDGVVYHTYSTYARGLDSLWGMYQWLDRAPKGRNEEEAGIWWRHHDKYESSAQKAGSCCQTAEGDA
jgi:predicted dithiol-disulfide oxidoreductase (DUF899 family)